MTSDWRGGGGAGRRARGKPEALRVVARHRHLHHLDGAAGKPERHPHQRARACPDDEVGGGGDEETLVRELMVQTGKETIIRADGLARAWIEYSPRARRDGRSL